MGDPYLLMLGVAAGLELVAAYWLSRRFAQLRRISRNRATAHPDSPSLVDHTLLGSLWQEQDGTSPPVLQAVPDLVIQMDRHGKYLRVLNPGIISLLKPQAVIPGNTVFDALPAELAYQRIHYIQLALQSQKIQGYEFQIELNGSIQYEEARIAPCEDGTVLVIVRDISDRARLESDRKRLELALQSSEIKLKNVVNSVNASITSFRLYPDRHWEYEYWSEGCEVVFGYTAAEFLADPMLWVSRVFPEDIARGGAANPDHWITDCPTTLQGEYRFFHKDGRLRWSSFHASCRPDEAYGWVVTVVDVDITDRKKTEESLRQSEEIFRRPFDDAPIGISLVSPTGQFLKMNAYYCNLLGYTEAELLSLRFQDITAAADLEADVEGFRQMVAGEIRSFQMEKRYITRQGMAIPVLLNAAIIRDCNEQPLWIVGHIQDIRDRRKVEKMKDEFISIISHELRTPLTSIQGALDLLGSGVYTQHPEKMNRMLQIAISNSNRLVHLVNDILDLERLGSGKVKLVKQQCQVTDLMQQAIDSVQAIADQAAITLSLTPLSATLRGAPGAIVQILTNLLSNAIKFSEIGGTVWLKAELKPMGAIDETGQTTNTAPPVVPPSSILFSVKDQGRGIPEDKLEVIFEQFQQVDVSDSRRRGGTGLGLAICKKIVQQHGGKIWVDSILGTGSTFYFTVPLVEESENDSANFDC